jgi:AAA domain
MVKAVAIVTGRDLLGCKPIRRLKVWYWNLEDSMEEIERRFHAIFLHYGIKREEIEGQLFVNSGRDKASLFGCGRRTVGRQPLDGENDDAHGHEEGARRFGHRDEGENDQYRTDNTLNPLV